MGLLDDAIREHLDLKRRRGADPSEIERAEREALGPVRRAPEPVAQDDADEPPEYEAAGEEDWDPADEADELADVHNGYAGSSSHGEAEDHEASHYEDSANSEHPADYEEPAQADAPAFPAALTPAPGEPGLPPPHPADGPPSTDATIEYSLEDEPQTSDEDVLEETPEFLQDAPEHDRLWFEQRPPRDFDFNE